MNRTILVASLFVVGWLASAAAQEPGKPAAPKVQPDRVDELVAAMRAAEKGLKTVSLQLSTSGQVPGGLTVTTRGSLHVVLGPQAALHSKFEYALSNDMRGRAESAQTAAGIVLFEDDPVFGEVFVQIDAKYVADLEWAGRVLNRDDLFGMPPQEGTGSAPDRRLTSPLGSAIVAALKKQFELAEDKRTTRQDEAGVWLVGPRRPGLDVQDPDLPVADRIELFVRTKDKALLETRYFVGETVVQQLVVDSIQIDVDLPPKLFQVDGGGQRLRPVQEHAPLWEQIEQACVEAEAKCEKEADAKNEKLPTEQRVKPEIRPSKR